MALTSSAATAARLAFIQAGFDHMDEGISMYDSEHRLVAWNRAFPELVEFPVDLLHEGLPITDLIRFNIERGTYGKGDPKKILASRLALLDTRERQTFDRARSDGGIVEINWFPLSNGGLVITYRDVTEKKERDAQLQQARKMEAVGRLTGGVAHEFNNLLTVILGNLEILETRLGKDSPLQSFTSSALKGALRGAQLTQGLLAFSRKQRLEAGETDINGLVLGMQSLLQRTLGEAIIIETDLAEGLWQTSADPGQIEAALLNFVLNARDAVPDGGAITVRTSNVSMAADTAVRRGNLEPGDYVTLEVRDTGTGMTEEQVEHAFEPFYTTKGVGEGTGLGLSVAYGFARQSGGWLEIESAPGQGTLVRLSLPRSPGEDGGAGKEQSEPAEPSTGTGKIMVVEDDAEVRGLVVSQLAELGYEIIEAEDGPEMLALLDEHSDTELLFSDVILPGGMNGPEAAEQARRKYPHLKVLFTSGYPEKDVHHLNLGGRDVAILCKPYRKFELAEAIAAAMKSR